MARARSDLALLVKAWRETYRVLVSMRIETTGDRMANTLGKTPKWMLIPVLRLLLATRFAEVGGAWHCMQAPDEMQQLGMELLTLVEKSSLSAPALHELFSRQP